MELELVRIVADWLEDPTYGVNALLPLLPRDAGDPQPANVSVADETRDAWVTRDHISAEGHGITFPALAVTVHEWLVADGEIGAAFRDGDVDIAIQYVTATQGVAAGNAAALYTLRAAERSLAYLLDNAHANSRARNGIHLVSCAKMRQAPITIEKDGIRVSSALVASFHFRDTVPGVRITAVAEVRVTPDTASVLTGIPQQLVATAYDASGNLLGGQTFTWSTSNAAIATVSATGLVTAIDPPPAPTPLPVMITATCDGVGGVAHLTTYELIMGGVGT